MSVFTKICSFLRRGERYFLSHGMARASGRDAGRAPGHGERHAMNRISGRVPATAGAEAAAEGAEAGIAAVLPEGTPGVPDAGSLSAAAGAEPGLTRVRTNLLRAIIHAVRAHDSALLARSLADAALPDASWRLVGPLLAEPVDPRTVAGGAGDGDEALILYVVSRFVVRDVPVVNHEYFERLAAALRITPAGKIEIERKIGRMKRRDVSLN